MSTRSNGPAAPLSLEEGVNVLLCNARRSLRHRYQECRSRSASRRRHRCSAPSRRAIFCIGFLCVPSLLHRSVCFRHSHLRHCSFSGLQSSMSSCRGRSWRVRADVHAIDEGFDHNGAVRDLGPPAHHLRHGGALDGRGLRLTRRCGRITRDLDAVNAHDRITHHINRRRSSESPVIRACVRQCDCRQRGAKAIAPPERQSRS